MGDCGGHVITLQRQNVDERRFPRQTMIQRRADLKDPIAVRFHFLRTLERFDPHAFHGCIHFAKAVQTHPAARSIAQVLRTTHRAGHACKVQCTLPAHLTIEYRTLAELLRHTEECIGAVIANPLP